MLPRMNRRAGIIGFVRDWSPALLLGVLYLHAMLPHGHDVAAPLPAAEPTGHHAHHGHGPQEHSHGEDAGSDQHHHELSAHSDTHHTGRQDRDDGVAPPPVLALAPAVLLPAPPTETRVAAPGREPPPSAFPLPAAAVRGPPATA